MGETARETALLALLETAARTTNGGEPRALTLVESKTSEGEMPALHAHDVPEAFYVLEGALTVYAGDEKVEVEAGESFVSPAGVPHTHRADSKGARYLAATFVASAGRYEDFLRAVGRPPGRRDRSYAGDWASGEEAAGLTAIAAANGIRVFGPPGALPAGS